jgi:hypothetical protein
VGIAPAWRFGPDFGAPAQCPRGLVFGSRRVGKIAGQARASPSDTQRFCPPYALAATDFARLPAGGTKTPINRYHRSSTFREDAFSA